MSPFKFLVPPPILFLSRNASFPCCPKSESNTFFSNSHHFVSIGGLLAVVLLPLSYSAVTEPRAPCGLQPHGCATRCALVLGICGHNIPQKVHQCKTPILHISSLPCQHPSTPQYCCLVFKLASHSHQHISIQISSLSFHHRIFGYPIFPPNQIFSQYSLESE